MKIGFQTIVWGPRYRNLEYMLDVISAAGYEGVEFMQRPEVLGSIERILRLLEERELKLIGLSGGSLRERMEFCGDFRPEYLLYVDTWNEQEACEAMNAGFTLGLHPHAYMPVGDLSDALEILENHPSDKYQRLKFVSDTAHLIVTYDDPISAIRQTKDRIVAVHLKDWTPEFGRSAHRYARGFVELGGGSVDLDEVVNELKQNRYGGWVIAAQEYTLTNPVTNTLESARWLANRKLLRPHQREVKLGPGLRGTGGRRTCSPKKEVLFLRSIARGHLQDINLRYDAIASAFSRLVSCKLVEVWTCSPAQEIMSLVAVRPDPGIPLETFIPNRREALSGVTMERKTVTHFDLADKEKENVERFEHPELVSRLCLKKMVSVPIFNPWNFNHVRLIVNLFPSGDKLLLSDDELFRFGDYVAFALDSALEDVCSACSTKLNSVASRCKGVSDFLDSLVEVVRATINCEGVAIFLVNEASDRLELKATTGTTWLVSENERFYRKGEGLTGWVWHTNETLLTADACSEQEWKGKSFEGVESHREDTCLFVPLTKPTGEVVGVIRCRNKSARRRLGKSEVFLLSDDDAAILESIAQAAIPHLELLLSRERHEKVLGRLTHELKVPLVAIRGAADFMRRTEGIDKVFDYDYPRDIWSWSELMGRLIDNADAFRYSGEGIQIKPTRTYLLKDVIAPAVKQVKLLLKERGFSPMNIDYSKEKFQHFPKLWLDKNQFQQVMFNLLSNAIKYAGKNPSAFHITIEGEERNRTEFLIWFRDWGSGIGDGTKEVIFEEGFRGENAVEMNVEGQGLGLWVVRQVVERHGGIVKVSNLRLPTEFTILLPYSLKSEPPA